MKRTTKKNLIAVLSLALLGTATAGAGLGVSFASAENVYAKPTGTNAEVLTQAIVDSSLESFKVQGASVRTAEPAGIRFLTTISNDDMAEIPAGAEFGTFIIPEILLDGELTENTANVLPAIAKVNTYSKYVPADSIGYFITLAGDTLATEFPAELYGTVFAARSFVRYTYTPEGETEAVTDYAYTSETVYRSISYVASAELYDLEKENKPDTNEQSFLNRIITATTADMDIALSATEVEIGDNLTATVTGATDGVNAFKYLLSSDNEEAVQVNEDGTLSVVGSGTATITAKIGVKEVSKTVEVRALTEGVEKSLFAYNLTGYNGLSKLTVTFDADSLNAEDIAMAELRNADNETVTAVYAKAVNNVATFDFSGVANAQNYNAVITTQKTATPVITSVVADYKETHDLAQIYGYMQSAIIANSQENVPNGYKWIDGPWNQNYGWLSDTAGKIKFLRQGASGALTIDAKGKLTVSEHVVAGADGSRYTNPVKMEFTDTTDIVSVSITQAIEKNGYFVWQWNNGDPGSKYGSYETAGVHVTTIDTATSTVWNGTIYTLVYYNQNESSYTFGDMVVNYQKALASFELANENGNPAKISDGVEVASYDLSATYLNETIKGLNVTFEETTETTATAKICDQYGDIVQTVEASISSNAAYFDLSAIENIENYRAVIESNATVASVSAEYMQTYNMAETYGTLYKDYKAGTISTASKEVDNVTFKIVVNANYTVSEDGKVSFAGTSTSNKTSNKFFRFAIKDMTYLSKLGMTVEQNRTAYINTQIYTTSSSSNTSIFSTISTNGLHDLETTDMTKVADGVSFIFWSNINAANKGAYSRPQTLKLTYNVPMTAGTLYVSAN